MRVAAKYVGKPLRPLVCGNEAKIEQSLKTDLNNIPKWSNTSNLSVNRNKSVFLKLHTSKQKLDNPIAMPQNNVVCILMTV